MLMVELVPEGASERVIDISNSLESIGRFHSYPDCEACISEALHSHDESLAHSVEVVPYGHHK